MKGTKAGSSSRKGKQPVRRRSGVAGTVDPPRGPAAARVAVRRSARLAGARRGTDEAEMAKILPVATHDNEVAAGAPVPVPVPCSAAVWDGVVPAVLADELLRNADELFRSNSSFFLPLSQRPRTAVEWFARGVFEQHFAAAAAMRGLEADLSKVDPETSGAEWWVQIRECDSDVGGATGTGNTTADSTTDSATAYADSPTSIGFHWDTDEDAQDATGEQICPAVATVTYLCSAGAPTMVVNKTPDALEQTFGEATSGVVVSYPAVGRHLKFDGTMLHGVPAELTHARSTDQRRITVLVNVWLDYQPLGVDEFPDEAIEVCNLARMDAPLGALVWRKRRGFNVSTAGRLDRVLPKQRGDNDNDDTPYEVVFGPNRYDYRLTFARTATGLLPTSARANDPGVWLYRDLSVWFDKGPGHTDGEEQ